MDQITQMTTAALPSAETLDLSKLTESEAFRALLSAIDARADEFETLGHIPRDIIALMKQARIFRSSTPTCFGGDAMAPHHFLKMVDAIGAVDGSSAWVAAFGSANTYTAALPYEAQQIMYAGGPDQVFAGGLHPVQKAVRAEGGWRVSGRWKFASGCMGADWIGVGIEGRGTSADGSDVPKVMMAVAPASEVEIIQSWNVSGMEGTGSHDTRVEDKFYSDLWICERGAPGIIDEPLYRYPAMAYQAQVHAACNLGLAGRRSNMRNPSAVRRRSWSGIPGCATGAITCQASRRPRRPCAERAPFSTTPPKRRGSRCCAATRCRASRRTCCGSARSRRRRMARRWCRSAGGFRGWV